MNISGNRPHEGLAEGEKYHRQERAHGSFRRAIQLPFRVDANNVDDEKGILKVTLPRAEEEKPQKIRIQTMCSRIRQKKSWTLQRKLLPRELRRRETGRSLSPASIL